MRLGKHETQNLNDGGENMLEIKVEKEKSLRLALEHSITLYVEKAKMYINREPASQTVTVALGRFKASQWVTHIRIQRLTRTTNAWAYPRHTCLKYFK